MRCVAWQARRRVNPRRSDPFVLFAGYPTRALQASDRLVPGAASDWAAAREILSRNLAMTGRWALAQDEECEAAFTAVNATAGATVGEILAGFPIPRRPYVERSLLWLMKFDILRLAEAAPIVPLDDEQGPA